MNTSIRIGILCPHLAVAARPDGPGPRESALSPGSQRDLSGQADRRGAVGPGPETGQGTPRHGGFAEPGSHRLERADYLGTAGPATPRRGWWPREEHGFRLHEPQWCQRS